VIDLDRERTEGEYKFIIGGSEWVAPEPLISEVRDITAMVPDDTLSDKERAAAGIEILFEQLQKVLRDEQGNPPSAEFLEENLSMRRAGKVLELVLGEGE